MDESQAIAQAAKYFLIAPSALSAYAHSDGTFELRFIRGSGVPAVGTGYDFEEAFADLTLAL